VIAKKKARCRIVLQRAFVRYVGLLTTFAVNRYSATRATHV